MAHPYDERTSFDLFLGAAAVAKFLDLDGNGTEDAGLYDQVREDADRVIDARLAAKYSVPFGTVPSLVRTISNHVTAALLLSKRHPTSPDAEYYMGLANELMDGLLTGKYQLPGATLASAGAGEVGLAYAPSTDPVFGLDDDDEDKTAEW